MFRPNAIATGRENAVGINSVFQLFLQSPERVIVEGVGICTRIHESWRRAVLAPTMLRCKRNHSLERLAILPIRLGIVTDWKSVDLEERAFMIELRQRQPERIDTPFLERLAEHLLAFLDGLTRQRNDR